MNKDLIPNFDDTGWPMVVPGDDGLRPAGEPDKCFYCSQQIGTPHRRDCVIVSKKVKIQYIFEDEVDIPHSWTSEQFEYHHNKGTWCADNAMDMIEEKLDKVSCACSILTVKFIEVIDPTPRREVKSEEQTHLDEMMREFLDNPKQFES